MNVERKIASSETTNVKNVNGNRSIRHAVGMNGNDEAAIHNANHTTWMYTKFIDPTNRLIASASRSVSDRSASAAFSSSATISTLRRVSSESDVDPASSSEPVELVIFDIDTLGTVIVESPLRRHRDALSD